LEDAYTEQKGTALKLAIEDMNTMLPYPDALRSGYAS